MTKIQWTDRTWNPVTGCTRVSEGCRNCYAERLTATRLRHQPKYQGLAVMQPGGPRWTNEVRTHPDELRKPLSWRKPRKVFVCDMSDLFHEAVPFDFIDQVFAVMALCPHLTFQVLTKRPERMAEYLIADRGPYKFEADHTTSQNWIVMARDDVSPGGDHPSNTHRLRSMPWPLPNVWLGTSLSTQKEADANIPHLLKCPAAVRFLSVEPLIEAVDLPLRPSINRIQRERFVGYSEATRIADAERIHWVITGGESGPTGRPCNIAHLRSIVQQCKAANVPCFVKQLGAKTYQRCPNCGKNTGGLPRGMLDLCSPDHEALGHECIFRDPKGGDPAEWPEDLRVREFPKSAEGGAA